MRIAVLVTDMFEDSEYTEPVNAFREKGYEIVHVGLRKGSHVKGKKEGTMVRIEEAVRDASLHDFDALFIPGGFSPDILRADPDAVRFARDFAMSGKPIFAICHGPQLLISAGVLQGRTLTGWKSIVPDLRNAGANYLDREVVIDGNLITSRSPEDIPAFNQMVLKKLEEVAAHTST